MTYTFKRFSTMQRKNLFGFHTRLKDYNKINIKLYIIALIINNIFYIFVHNKIQDYFLAHKFTHIK